MTTMYKYIIVLILLFPFGSCRNNDTEDNRTTMSNNVVSLEGLYTFFYPNGKLHYQVNYVDNKKHGLEKSFYEDGSVKSIGKYEYGKQDSIWTWFFENGMASQTESWVNGHLFGQAISYYNDNRIKQFSFYSFGDELAYTRGYNSKGEVTSEEGIAPVAVAFSSSEISVNDTFVLKVILGLLPNWKAELTINEKSGDFRKTITIDKFDPASFGYIYVYNSSPKGHETYTLNVIVKITAEHNKVLYFNDTVQYSVRQK